MMQLKTLNANFQLTPRQLQLLKMIAEFQSSLYYSPTLAEMASKLNLSRSTIFEHLAELRKKGFLTGSTNKARSLELSLKAQELLNDFLNIDSVTETNNQNGIPIAGVVAAGLPLEAVENVEILSLDSCFGNNEEVFALEVTGDSMIDDDIRPGDYVICKKAETARDGQIVVAIIDNENATLKRFFKEKKQVRLQPANSNYQPVYSNNCRINAVVIGLIRKF